MVIWCGKTQRRRSTYARLLIKILMGSQPGDYVIYSQKTEQKSVAKA